MQLECKQIFVHLYLFFSPNDQAHGRAAIMRPAEQLVTAGRTVRPHRFVQNLKQLANIRASILAHIRVKGIYR